MTDNNEEEQNIDDLVDYNDFDSRDFGGKDDMDSFNNDILKFYEDHKKNISAKTNEATNSQRPISSYHRIMVTDYKKDISFNQEKEAEAKAEENEEDKLYNVYENVEDEAVANDLQEIHEVHEMNDFTFDYTPSDYTKARNKLNDFVIKNKLTRDKICDNINLFLNFEDFKEMFKKVRFDCKPSDLMILFIHQNANKDEGYISIRKFFEMISLSFYEIKTIEVEKPILVLDHKKINDEFKNLHSEILDVINKDMFEENTKPKKRLKLNSAKPKLSNTLALKLKESPVKPNLEVIPSVSSLKKIASEYTLSSNRPQTSMPSLKKSVNANRLSLISARSETKPKLDITKVIEENLNKHKNEDINIRNSLDKRQKELIRNCKEKALELNKICKEMNIDKSFNIIVDDVKFFYF
jgi:hypothetical protein